MKIFVLAPPSPDRDAILAALKARGYEPSVQDTAARALAELPSNATAFTLVDLGVRKEALAFLRALVTHTPPAWTVAIGDRRDAGVTGEALRLGVVDVIPRPVREGDVIAALANAREFAGLAGRRQPPPPELSIDGVFTQSPRMREVYEIARRIAPSRCPVMLLGERGTGRETVARAIHRHGPMREEPFVKHVAGSDPPAALEKALNGKGRGVLYVEDVSLLSSDQQGMLDGWLASHVHDAVTNGHAWRVIAGAQPRLNSMLRRRAFRQSLYDALSVVRVDLPTLRERPHDIPLLAMFFMKDACAKYELPAKTLSRSALALLSVLPWRGNAAELRGLMDRLALMVPRGVVLQEDVLQHVRLDDAEARGASGGTLRDARREFEREFIASVLQRHQWRMESAASELGIERTNLYRKMKQLQISRGDTRS